MPNDYFMRYQAIEKPVFFESDLFNDKPINISSWAEGYSPSGNIMIKESPAAKELKSKMNLDYENDTTEIVSPYNSTSVNKGIKGDKKKAVEFFINKGLSPHAAAGIVGNLIQESSLNTGAIGDNNTSFGIAQWHNERGKNLKDYAKKQNKNWTDFDIQLEFLWDELNTSYSGVLAQLQNSSNVDQATDIFLDRFEKPKNPNSTRSTRRNHARSLLS